MATTRLVQMDFVMYTFVLCWIRWFSVHVKIIQNYQPWGLKSQQIWLLWEPFFLFFKCSLNVLPDTLPFGLLCIQGLTTSAKIVLNSEENEAAIAMFVRLMNSISFAPYMNYSWRQTFQLLSYLTRAASSTCLLCPLHLFAQTKIRTSYVPLSAASLSLPRFNEGQVNHFIEFSYLSCSSH